MKKILFLFSLAMLIALPITVHGQTNAATETMVFDSTDNYTGGCSLTATSTWTLPNNLTVTKFQMWYKWQTGETELPIAVTKDGETFAAFTATRSACDPYQTSWCNADYAINKTFPAGTYTTTIANAYQCLKPGSTGTVRLYGSVATTTNANSASNLVATENSNTNSAVNTNTTVSNVNTQNNNAQTTATKVDDTKDSNTLVYVLIGIIVILVIVIIVKFLSCRKKAKV